MLATKNRVDKQMIKHDFYNKLIERKLVPLLKNTHKPNYHMTLAILVSLALQLAMLVCRSSSQISQLLDGFP